MTEGSTAQKLSDKFSYADYLTWPDDERWELINGAPYNMTPAPKPRHQRVQRRLTRIMDNFLAGHKCELFPSPFDVRFPPEPKAADDAVDTVVQPDISVICDESKIDDHGCVGPPDVVAEIVSEETGGRDETIKLRLYEEHGVREYWIVNPWDATVRIYNLDEHGKYGFPRLVTKLEIAESGAVEGLTVNLNDVFPHEQ